MRDFEFILTSCDDYDSFVTEIWYQNNLIAITKEDGTVQLFDDNSLIVPDDLLNTAIDLAKAKLKG